MNRQHYVVSPLYYRQNHELPSERDSSCKNVDVIHVTPSLYITTPANTPTPPYKI